MKCRHALALFALLIACSPSSDSLPADEAPRPPLRWVKRVAPEGAAFRDVAFDREGNLVAVGGVGQAGLATTPGAAQREFGGHEDVYAVKYSAAGEIVWATYLGGKEIDRAYAVEVDADGNVVLGGRCGESFPVTANAAQRELVGGGDVSRVYPEPQDGWAAKLNGATGALIWATFLGASDRHSSIVRDVAVDPATGAVYLAASTDTGTYPAHVREAFKRGHRATLSGGIDGVLAKLSPDGSRFEWATYLGGSQQEGPTPSVRVDSAGDVVALYTSWSPETETTEGAFDRTHNGASDYYLSKFKPSGELVWATFLGGGERELFETHNLAVRRDGAIVVAGGTTSLSVKIPISREAAFPANAGNGSRGFGENTNYPGDCSVHVIAPSGDKVLAGTYYGGSEGDGCEGVDVDEAGRVYVTGGTYSSDLPLTPDALEPQISGHISGYLAVFDRDLTKLEYATYMNYGPNGSLGRSLAYASGVAAIGGMSDNRPGAQSPSTSTVWTYRLGEGLGAD